MRGFNNYKRLESCSKEELIEKIIVRDKHCNDLKKLLDKGLEKYKKLKAELHNTQLLLKAGLDDYMELEEENKKLKEELERYKKQYKHTIGGDYIDEDLYDLDC